MSLSGTKPIAAESDLIPNPLCYQNEKCSCLFPFSQGLNFLLGEETIGKATLDARDGDQIGPGESAAQQPVPPPMAI